MQTVTSAHIFCKKNTEERVKRLCIVSVFTSGADFYLNSFAGIRKNFAKNIAKSIDTGDRGWYIILVISTRTE